MASATSRAFFNTLPSSTAWLTKPHLSACSPEIGMAVRDASRALFAPITRESFCERPHEGNIPNLHRQFKQSNRALKSKKLVLESMEYYHILNPITKFHRKRNYFHIPKSIQLLHIQANQILL